MTASIVGREPEFALLCSFLAQAGDPTVALLTGEAGIGKTTLMSAVTAEPGRRVLLARPTEAEAQSAYAAIDELVRPCLTLLEDLPGPQARAIARALLLGGGDAHVEPRLVALAFLSLAGKLPSPALIAIDDWQWLDAASRFALSFALRRLPSTGVKVIATARSGEADDAFAALVRALPEQRVFRLGLEPLDAPALQRVVHARTGNWVAPPALTRLHASSGGNPLFALELIRSRADRSVADIRWLLRRRVGGLSPEARQALRFTAALTKPTSELVERAIGDVVAARRGLEAALAADILVLEGTRLRFSHPLLAAVVAELAPPSEWRAVHARLAELSDGTEERVRHRAAAVEGPDGDVAELLEDAAEQAAGRGALASGAELSERAAAMTPDEDDALRARRLLRAADMHDASGDGRRARAVLEEIVTGTPAGPLRANALYRLAYTGNYRAGAQLAERALAEAGDDDLLRAHVHTCLALLAALQGSLADARGHAERALQHAQLVGEPSTLAEAIINFAYMRWISVGGVYRDELLRADELERSGPGLIRDCSARATLAMQLRTAGELAEARELLEADLARATDRGQLDHEHQALRLLAEVEVRAGRWRLADHYADQTLEATLGTARWNSEGCGYWVRALVDAHLGRVDSARENSEAGLECSRQLDDLAWSTRCSHVLGFLELSLGDAAAAVERLSPLPEQERRLGAAEPARFGFAPDLAEALVLTGDLERARTVQADLERRGRNLGRAWAIATALRCRGLIAAAEGRSGDALIHLGHALQVHDDVPQPFDRARTLLALGTTQRRAKQRAAARVSLAAALTVFEQLGAALWADRARAEIARFGGRHARDRDELTATERRIAELAADGRSNREIASELFVSERTVEANLTRAYRKLGLRSRTELARRLPAR